VVKQIGVIIEPNDEINIAIDSALAPGNGSKDPWVSRVELTSQAPDLSAVRPDHGAETDRVGRIPTVTDSGLVP
jgi:hypothetical protein